MPVTLDPDAAAVFKRFRKPAPRLRDADAPQAREFYLRPRRQQSRTARTHIVAPAFDPRRCRIDPARIYTPKTLRLAGGLRRAWCFFTARWVIGDLDSTMWYAELA